MDRDITLRINDVEGAEFRVSISELMDNTTDTGEIASLAIAREGEYRIPFMAHKSTVFFKIVNNSLRNLTGVVDVSQAFGWKQVLQPQTVVTKVCNSVKDGYPFGFNGQMKTNEIAGVGNSIDFGARMYSPRIARFISRDPLAIKFPSESPYLYAGNNPIFYIDKKGEHKVSADNEAAYRKAYPMIMTYLATQLERDVANSTKIIEGLVSTNPNILPSTVKAIFKWGFGPEIIFKDDPGYFPAEYKSAAGYTDPEASVTHLNARYAAYVERVLESKASAKVKQAAFARLYMTIVHEAAHELNKYGKVMGTDASGNPLYKALPNGGSKGYSDQESGYKAEEKIWGTDNYKPDSSPAKNANDPGVEGITSEKYQPGVVEGVCDEASKTPEGKASLPTVPTAKP